MSEYVAGSVEAPPEIKLIPKSGSRNEQDAMEAKPLWSNYPHRIELKKEQPHHRIMVLLKAAGMSNKEIAEATGYEPCTVGVVVRQPWAMQQIVEEIQKNGQDAIQTILQGSALDSVMKLIELRDADDSPKEVQRKSANDLLDRVFGKPNQPVSHRSEDLATLTDAELEQIARKGAN